MFRSMRRSRQALSQKECEHLLNKVTSGVLALSGDEGYPYALPISFVYDEGKLYFHSAKSGHKIDAIKKEPKASFCIIDQDTIVPEKYTTYFRSVIAFGKLSIIEDELEKYAAIDKLARKYAPNDTIENRCNEIQREWQPLCMLVMDIEHLSGKEAIELVRQKSKENM
ncbi:MAG TPA: pyridoxamine 5'-phosphate oxidase family protein [Candidatus Fimiplasma intestinipullorum]|uniref:Pyridoxamine 5'-phosphate oxidase family protein n=1 Tax=Candidatus Fimiplasma intestinipullorum TaxID=2840825 RepID=A0A9D1HLH8_9FIRM|nr:pyridoxamine 5'-phosphate oxidase family protein [Candidatus Fimiplasma intestinipullorum]